MRSFRGATKEGGDVGRAGGAAAEAASAAKKGARARRSMPKHEPLRNPFTDLLSLTISSSIAGPPTRRRRRRRLGSLGGDASNNMRHPPPLSVSARHTTNRSMRVEGRNATSQRDTGARMRCAKRTHFVQGQTAHPPQPPPPFVLARARRKTAHPRSFGTAHRLDQGP